MSALARRRAEFDASLAKFAASCPPVVAAVRRAPPALVVGLALAGGAVLGRVVGFKRLFAPATLVAGAIQEQLVKALLGAARRLWDANIAGGSPPPGEQHRHRREEAPPENAPPHEPVTDPTPDA